MKTLICEQPGQWEMKDSEPPVLTQGHAIVNIQRVGICGTDLHAFQGNQPFFQYPRILGHELAGVIEEVDGQNHGFQAGDQVTIIPYLHCGSCIACRNGKTNCCTDMKVMGVHVDGGMREKVSVPVTHLINTQGLTLEQTAVIEPLAIGAHAVRRAQLTPGECVAVVGAGPIGLGVMAFAKQAGASVIAVDINDERLAFCKEWAGASHTVNARSSVQEQLKEITNGDMPSVVFDATGNAGAMEASFLYPAHGGTLVFVGLVNRELTFNDPEFHKRELSLLASRNATLADFEHVIEVVRQGNLDFGRYITHQVSFVDMPEQFSRWTDPANGVIKAMITL
ncbi:zinc-binding alcohol dehydrogenase family protein [Paenibacillus lemnae]|uniref:Zinc-binding alcohol dehydrogenase family protein n=1 Tax=Paenibacillus lemnae TaxID=1330551 RepID=A0A848M6X7_PAELE|nr:zinc-binding alcohol dehydrogenase family protein [Paenibacillus lemnae]NMO95832.1 zinc-binding alcohol dehydrogenase family protein [Paenibacillus lemnae]